MTDKALEKRGPSPQAMEAAYNALEFVGQEDSRDMILYLAACFDDYAVVAVAAEREACVADAGDIWGDGEQLAKRRAFRARGGEGK